MTLLLLLLGCTPLVGDWSGEVDCGDYAMDVEIALEWGDGEYEGSGDLDCTDGYGMDCRQTFDVQVETEQWFGEQDLDVDVDDCQYTLGGSSGEAACTNPDDIEWDGADVIAGEWGGCDFELERD